IFSRRILGRRHLLIRIGRHGGLTGRRRGAASRRCCSSQPGEDVPSRNHAATVRGSPGMATMSRAPSAQSRGFLHGCCPGDGGAGRMHSKCLLSLALPTEARHSGYINGLAPSLGKSCPIERQREFPGRPKPTAPPQNRTAAPTGIGSGGDEIGKLASYSEVEFYL